MIVVSFLSTTFSLETAKPQNIHNMEMNIHATLKSHFISRFKVVKLTLENRGSGMFTIVMFITAHLAHIQRDIQYMCASTLLRRCEQQAC